MVIVGLVIRIKDCIDSNDALFPTYWGGRKTYISVSTGTTKPHMIANTIIANSTCNASNKEYVL